MINTDMVTFDVNTFIQSGGCLRRRSLTDPLDFFVMSIRYLAVIFVNQLEKDPKEGFCPLLARGRFVLWPPNFCMMRRHAVFQECAVAHGMFEYLR